MKKYKTRQLVLILILIVSCLSAIAGKGLDSCTLFSNSSTLSGGISDRPFSTGDNISNLNITKDNAILPFTRAIRDNSRLRAGEKRNLLLIPILTMMSGVLCITYSIISFYHHLYARQLHALIDCIHSKDGCKRPLFF